MSSPPGDDLCPSPPVIWIVVGGIRVPLVLQPPPPPPNWEQGLETPGLALCAIGMRFRQIAQTLEKGSLKDQFTTSSDLLLDAGLSRLG